MNSGSQYDKANDQMDISRNQDASPRFSGMTASDGDNLHQTLTSPSPQSNETAIDNNVALEESFYRGGQEIISNDRGGSRQGLNNNDVPSTVENGTGQH